MTAGPHPAEYVLARRVLLDALDALGPHRAAVVLVGAQAVYLHTGDGDLAVAPTTTDAGGWGKGIIGLESTVPVIAFIPMFMFAVLFGLSMDYEVFLLSRDRPR